MMRGSIPPRTLVLLAALGCVACPSADDGGTPDDDDVTADDDDAAGDDDDSGEPPPTTWRSTLYPAHWTPNDVGPDGAFLHDFSYAGYRRSEAPLPDTAALPAFSADIEGADPTGTIDSTDAIQTAIDAAELAGGGRVTLSAGTYRVDDLLVVDGSGVVLTGAGIDETHLWFTRLAGMSDRGHLTFQGAPTWGADLPLTEDAPNRASEIAVADGSGLNPGDSVDVGWTVSPQFVAEHGMDSFWEVSNGQWRAFFRREVVSVDVTSTPHRVELDVPLRYPALTRDGASIRPVSGRLEDVGVEQLGVSTAGTPADAWSLDRNHAVLFRGVRDAWMRDVASLPSPSTEADGAHLASGGVKVLDSARVTISGCSLAAPQNRGGGGNGYLYEVSRSGEVLVMDSVGRGGRHNFIQNWDFGTSGVVWLRTTSLDGEALTGRGGFGTVGASEFHHSLAMANLIDDSVIDDAWKAVNRRTFSSGAGHTATESVFWNVRGSGALTSFQYGLGYVIGTGEGLDVVTDLDQGGLFAEASGTEPEDWREGIGEGSTLEPRSLFEDQLARRLAP